MTDVAAYFDIYSRWDVMQWLGEHPRRALQDEAEAVAALRRWGERHASLAPPLGLWALVPSADESANASPIGTLLLLPLTEHGVSTGETEIGWHLHPAYQGAGWATEGARALLAAACDAGLDRVVAVIDPENEASLRVARRLGLKDEGLTDRWFGITARQYAVDGRTR